MKGWVSLSATPFSAATLRTNKIYQTRYQCKYKLKCSSGRMFQISMKESNDCHSTKGSLVGFVIGRFRDEIFLSATRWICVWWSQIQLLNAL